MATIYDIAKLSGVSPATVSKALSGAPDVSEATRQRIRQLAESVNYVPDSRAKGLSQKRSFTFSILCQDGSELGLRHYLFASIIESFRSYVEQQGYDIVFISNQMGKMGLTYYGHCRYRKADGVFIINTNYSSKDAIELIESDIPKIAFDFSNDAISCVMTDCEKSMELLYGHLYDLGHRNVAYLHGEISFITKLRIEGLRKAMAKRGQILKPRQLIQSKYYSIQGGDQSMREALSLSERPTAVIASDDYSAMGVIQAAQEMGLRVPEDISVVGFDGITITQLSSPKLTTIRQDTGELGVKAAEALLRQIGNPAARKLQKNIVLEPQLMVGNSCRRI